MSKMLERVVALAEDFYKNCPELYYVYKTGYDIPVAAFMTFKRAYKEKVYLARLNETPVNRYYVEKLKYFIDISRPIKIRR